MADLTRSEIDDYRKKNLLPRGLGNALNELDHRVCDMALKGVTYTAPPEVGTHPDTARLDWLDAKARAHLHGVADAIVKFMERGASLREAIDSARGDTAVRPLPEKKS